MEQTLYELMDWAGIEELTYSEAANPHAMLGPHLTDNDSGDAADSEGDSGKNRYKRVSHGTCR